MPLSLCKYYQTAAVYSVIMLIGNGIFVRVMMMKLRYILTMLLAEDSAFATCMMLQLIKCIPAADI